MTLPAYKDMSPLLRRKLRIAVGYLTSGNSVWDLVAGMYSHEGELDELIRDLKDTEEQTEISLTEYENIGAEFEELQNTVISG